MKKLGKKVRKRGEETLKGYSLILGLPDKKLRKPTQKDLIFAEVDDSIDKLIQNIQKTHNLSLINASKEVKSAIKELY